MIASASRRLDEECTDDTMSTMMLASASRRLDEEHTDDVMERVMIDRCHGRATAILIHKSESWLSDSDDLGSESSRPVKCDNMKCHEMS